MRPVDYFLRSVRRVPEQPFLLDDERTWSYGEAANRVESIAAGLYEAGFELGDSVAVYSPNHPEAVICVFACRRAGAGWVPVNVRNSAASNAEYMAYVKTKWLFFRRQSQA